LKFDVQSLRQLDLALRDLGRGLADWRVWTFMAQHEIRQRYRRSTLGPLWLTLGLAIHVIAISTIWSHLMSLTAREFVPYLTIGLMIWNLIVGTVVEGCHSFTAACGYITQTNRPLSAYAFQTLFRNLLIAAHNLIVYVAAALVFQLAPNQHTLWVVPGVVAMILAMSWAPFLLGVLSARFRDIPLIVQSVMTVVFFLTPVLWHAEQLGERAFFASMNPLAHLIEVVRAPLLGKPLAAQNWIVTLATAGLGWSLTLLVFARNRARIPYWL
jgi:ABC-2 type transport system permease protein/lipopolysaccharide transport system permease protein